MTVYILSKRGTLHKAEQTASGRLSFEADNLDSAQVTVYSELAQVPIKAMDRLCKRCFPKVGA